MHIIILDLIFKKNTPDVHFHIINALKNHYFFTVIIALYFYLLIDYPVQRKSKK